MIANLPPNIELSPYRATPGPEFDAVIHKQVMAEPAVALACPRYSTDFTQARKVLAKLRSSYATAVVFGETSLADRRWFARIESKRGVEVLAETLPLAICRLALLRVRELETKGQGSGK
jgi:hypothetical protein